MAVWPASLPQVPTHEAYGETGKFPVIQAPIEQGPPLSRRRFTAAVVPVQCSYVFTGAQLVTFEAFWNNDIAMGALPYTAPVRGNVANTATFQNTAAFQLAPMPRKHWRVTLTLLRLP